MSGTARMALVSGLLLVAAGCAAGRVHNVDIASQYRPGDIRAFAGSPTVEVVGAPAAGVTAEEVAAVLRMPGHIGGGPFAAAGPDAAARTESRVVLVFAPGGGADRAAICQGGADGAVIAPGADMRVAGAVCAGGRTLTYARLTGAPSGPPSDPAVASALNDLLHALTPNCTFRDRTPSLASVGADCENLML